MKQEEKEWKLPSISDVKLTITSIHNKMPAPPEHVWFVCKLTYGKMTYSNYLPVKRKGMPVEVENAVKGKVIANFWRQVAEKLNLDKVTA